MLLQYSYGPRVAALNTMMQSNSPEGAPHIRFHMFELSTGLLLLLEYFWDLYFDFGEFPTVLVCNYKALVESVDFHPQ